VIPRLAGGRLGLNVATFDTAGGSDTSLLASRTKKLTAEFLGLAAYNRRHPQLCV
jgi:hypothetical protein